MRDFFKGWRRKVGCIVLAIALVSMCGWMRSYFVVDTISYVPDEGARHLLTLSPYGIQWSATQGVGPRLLGWQSFTYNKEEFGEPMQGWDAVWDWRFCGFQSGVYQLRGDALDQRLSIVFAETSIWTIPYWSVVLPLTLLSACLILWKPRPKAKPNA